MQSTCVIKNYRLNLKRHTCGISTIPPANRLDLKAQSLPRLQQVIAPCHAANSRFLCLPILPLYNMQRRCQLLTLYSVGDADTGRTILIRESRSARRKIYPIFISFPIYPTWTILGWSPGLRVERQTD